MRVKARADMISFMEWVGEVPDDIPENEIWYWIKKNIDGGDFTDTGCGDWVSNTEVEILEDEDET